jgi:hypothetical protein
MLLTGLEEIAEATMTANVAGLCLSGVLNRAT